MRQKIRKFTNFISTVVVILMLALVILLVGPRILGMHVFSVLSGSMEPTYHVGALIYVKSVDTAELQEGDVITFMLDEDTVATHRIVKVVPDEEDPSVLRFRTKGDANDSVDGSLVHYKNVVGTPVFTIPKLGYFADIIQHPPGMYIAISVAAIVLLILFLPDLLFSDDSEKKEKKQKKGKHAANAEGDQ